MNLLLTMLEYCQSMRLGLRMHWVRMQQLQLIQMMIRGIRGEHRWIVLYIILQCVTGMMAVL